MRDAYLSSTPPLAHATVVIRGESVLPEFWSRYFDVTPSRTRTIGQPYRYPSGKLSDRPATVGLWAYESQSAIQSDNLEPHLRYLIQILRLPRDGLRDLLKRERISMSIWCFWLSHNGRRIPHIPDETRALVEATGGTLEVDEYEWPFAGCITSKEY